MHTLRTHRRIHGLHSSLWSDQNLPNAYLCAFFFMPKTDTQVVSNIKTERSTRNEGDRWRTQPSLKKMSTTKSITDD